MNIYIEKKIFKKLFYFLLLLPMLSFAFNVGDKVWNDENQDWEQNAGESGYSNVIVELYDASNQRIQTTTTNREGNYNFYNVAEGEYLVKVLPPQGFTLVTRNNIELWVEQDRTDIDFGISTESVTQPSTYTVGDRVWNDINEDWEQNQGEEGLEDITVELYNDLGEKVQSVSTNAQGNYLFTNISEGEYSIKVVPNSNTRLVTLNSIDLWIEANRTDIDFGLIKKDTSGVVSINEVLAANANTNLDPDYKQFSDWIELYNNENHSVDIGQYYLSNDSDKPKKWVIPTGTRIAAHAYLLIWADKEDTEQLALHTNFKLSQKGDKVLLSDSNGVLVDSIKFHKQKTDISCAKVAHRIVYMNPTPNAVNSETHKKTKQAKKPTFSLKSGFYSGAQALELSQKHGGEIYFTTDGSVPTKLSTKYTQPINVNKTMIVRARAFRHGKFLSSIRNRTYLINENITIPVISIGINDEYLNDSDIGIYKNYTKKWIRAGSVEYIKNGKSKFNENVGIRIFGGQTRKYAQKSLAIYAKERYGAKSIKYSLFPDKPQIKKVKSFVLRNSGNDWGYTMMKDGMVHSVVKDKMDIDYQSYQPTIVFINGQYWGIQNIREKLNEDYIEANHGVDAKKVDLLEAQYEVKEGSNSEYKSLIKYIKNNTLADNTHYEYVKSKIDIDEYINYMIVEIYGGNLDWPYSNIKYWREQKSTGQWRWMLYDTDRTFEDPELDMFALLFDPNGAAEPNPPWSTFLFRNLMKNSTFKQKFVNTFKKHLDTTFRPSRISHIISSIKNKIAPEIQRHFNKWQRRDQVDWETGVAELDDFASQRANELKAQLSHYFN